MKGVCKVCGCTWRAFQKDTLVEACIEMIIALKVAEQEGKAFVPWPQDDVKGGCNE